MRDCYYYAPVCEFLETTDDAILGQMARAHHHDLDPRQRNAWLAQITLLKEQLAPNPRGHLFFEFSIPRMGKRADALLVREGMLFVMEFKVGARNFDRHAIDQVLDYALDMKNFHLGSHDLPIVPILLATQASSEKHAGLEIIWDGDGVAKPVRARTDGLASVLALCCAQVDSRKDIDVTAWRDSGYRPTPTIIEAAEALYRGHNVEEISRSDAGAKNLQATAERIAEIIETAKREGRKSICFITGVPGAGKTLAGLNIAAKRAVFLSGNGPLVEVLREALAQNQVKHEHVKKTDALRSARSFIQNIHHFRDEYYKNTQAPSEKVVVFDEAQRAWTREQVVKFMRKRHGNHGFDLSEPEFLISVMDRHQDWCVIICLIGGGQEINTGEAGLLEWLTALQDHFSCWLVHASSLLEDRHYMVAEKAANMLQSTHIQKHQDLHLSVCMRSFRAERLSAFVTEVLDGDSTQAKLLLREISQRYPIVLTRTLDIAREWLRQQARGSERFGLVASSGGNRLRAEGIHVKTPINAPNWFLNDRLDVRSSCCLEEAATEFDIQGLELDWVGVCWDADLRRVAGAWQFFSFRGTKWVNLGDPTRQLYLRNAYRVLLTRARQGLVIFVPRGNEADATRLPEWYQGTYEYLLECGARPLDE